MQITVMRKVPFCAGHRLLHHEGKCANLHGHNYMVEFHVTGSEVDELGRVVDFAVINRLFKSWIDDNWDHGFILWNEDQEAIQALRQVTPHRIYENIARYLLLEIGPRLLEQVQGYDLQLSRVVVWETLNASATAALSAEAQLYTSADSAQEATE